jgi:hypothetical protein
MTKTEHGLANITRLPLLDEVSSARLFTTRNGSHINAANGRGNLFEKTRLLVNIEAVNGDGLSFRVIAVGNLQAVVHIVPLISPRNVENGIVASCQDALGDILPLAKRPDTSMGYRGWELWRIPCGSSRIVSSMEC